MMDDIFYPTASTTTVFVNGVHIEQAFRLDFKENLPKTPIFGYNDYFYSKVAVGKNIIQGMLIVNFTIPFYLNYVLSSDNGAFVPKLFNYDAQNSASDLDKYRKNITKKIASELPSNDEESKKARAQYLAHILSKGNTSIKAETEKAIYEVIKNTEPTEQISATTPNQLSSPLQSNIEIEDGALLDVYYTDPSTSLWFSRFYNVHFFDVTQQVNQAGAEGSSEPLYEIYSFIASRRETKLIKAQ